MTDKHSHCRDCPRQFDVGMHRSALDRSATIASTYGMVECRPRISRPQHSARSRPLNNWKDGGWVAVGIAARAPFSGPTGMQQAADRAKASCGRDCAISRRRLRKKETKPCFRLLDLASPDHGEVVVASNLTALERNLQAVRRAAMGNA